MGIRLPLLPPYILYLQAIIDVWLLFTPSFAIITDLTYEG